MSYGDVEFFHKVYPYAHVGTERSFAVSVIAAQYDYDKKDELERFALDIEKIYDGMYPIDYSDAEWPDHANESEPSKVAAM
jgi:hypothetical protein